ncbi:hypothetical protein AYI68_g6075 [Smittium mucronatum]|uniref:Uncharacterized protein n=1 Tax=Smittium mucronatum TaxID=133383 RepID=A0A1R0GSK0_9FUNG|nr:hypothetical protein AYI68_g6075 [Smittium mucronatum]
MLFSLPIFVFLFLGLRLVYGQSSETCLVDFDDVTVDSDPDVNQGYDLSKSIIVPCLSDAFQINFQVDDSSDIQFAISGTDSPFSNQSVVGSIGVESGIWSLFAEQSFPPAQQLSLLLAAPVYTSVSIKVDSTGAYIYRNGIAVLSLPIEDFDYEAFVQSNIFTLFFAADIPGTVISSISINCNNESGQCELPETTQTTEEPETTETSASSESSMCFSTSNIPPTSFSSIDKIKNYDINSPILLPCSTDAFGISFNVISDSDLFLAFSGSKGVYGADGSIEAQIGLLSGRYSIKRGIYSKKKRSILTKRYIPALIEVSYENGLFVIKRDGIVIIKYSAINPQVSQFYIAPRTGIAYVYSGVVTCQCIVPGTLTPPQTDCTIAYPLPDAQYTSLNVDKVYSSSNIFSIDCSGTNFEFSAAAASSSDFFILLQSSADSGFSLAESRFGIISSINDIQPELITLTSSEVISQVGPLTENVPIKLVFTNYILSIYLNNNLVKQIELDGFSPNTINFSSLNGTTNLSNRIFTCLSQNSSC